MGSRGVAEGGSGGLSPLLKIMRDFGGLSPRLPTSFSLDKFIIMHFPKEKKGTVRFYQKKTNATTLYSLSPSFNTFTYTGLTSTLLLYMQKFAWCTYFLQYSPPCYSFRTTPLMRSELPPNFENLQFRRAKTAVRCISAGKRTGPRFTD